MWVLNYTYSHMHSHFVTLSDVSTWHGSVMITVMYSQLRDCRVGIMFTHNCHSHPRCGVQLEFPGVWGLARSWSRSLPLRSCYLKRILSSCHFVAAHIVGAVILKYTVSMLHNKSQSRSRSRGFSGPELRLESGVVNFLTLELESESHNSIRTLHPSQSPTV